MEAPNGHLGDTRDISVFGLFPPVSYFQFAANRGEISLFTNLELSHYCISGANQIETLRIPLLHESKNKTPINWQISYQHKWVREHQNALRTAYGKSPFFEFYDYKLFEILDQQITSFPLLQETLIKQILPWLGLDELNVISSDLEKSRHYFRSLLSTPTKEYSQVFETKFGHRKNLSIIDLLFNIGPECAAYFRQ